MARVTVQLGGDPRSDSAMHAATPAEHVPPVVSWILTGKCNMQCVHCYPDSGPSYTGPDLGFEEKLRTVEQMAAAGVESVFLSGGETLLVPRVFDVIDAIHAAGMSTWICSNGSLVNPDTAAKIAQRGVRGVSISLDSGLSEIHDQFRRYRGAHAKALRAIRLLRERGVTVNVDYTATAANRVELAELYRVADELGVKGIFLKRFRPVGRGADNADRLALDLDEYQEVARELLACHRAGGPEVCFEDPAVYVAMGPGDTIGGLRSDSHYRTYGCLAGVVWMGIQPNGDITPCPLVQLPLGNVVRDDLRETVVGSEVMRRMRDRDDRGGRCGACAQRWSCGGCRAHALAVSGDAFAEDPFCVATRSPFWKEVHS